jgi:hypothetical protein
MNTSTNNNTCAKVLTDSCPDPEQVYRRFEIDITKPFPRDLPPKPQEDKKYEAICTVTDRYFFCVPKE